VPGLEVAYRKFLQDVGRETGDPKWNIRHHPARKILDRFPAAFGEWVRHLEGAIFREPNGRASPFFSAGGKDVPPRPHRRDPNTRC